MLSPLLIVDLYIKMDKDKGNQMMMDKAKTKVKAILDPAKESEGKTKNTPVTKDKKKKQLLLRLSPSLWQELAAWAEDDFRSINGQIEYLLTECVKQRKKDKAF